MGTIIIIITLTMGTIITVDTIQLTIKHTTQKMSSINLDLKVDQQFITLKQPEPLGRLGTMTEKYENLNLELTIGLIPIKGILNLVANKEWVQLLTHRKQGQLIINQEQGRNRTNQLGRDQRIRLLSLQHRPDQRTHLRGHLHQVGRHIHQVGRIVPLRVEVREEAQEDHPVEDREGDNNFSKIVLHCK